ncbi:MAG: ABC transporter permease [Ardenticatenaceae bacterium]|nr:ABC transporter permease [Anaerolineales bacterium]MCB8979631.1 ABC transporter permease [Ardenticatenaceae bacterium]
MQLSKRLPFSTWEYWRVVLTLAAKDTMEAFKNKTTLTMILGLVMMMATVEAMPLLLKLDDRPRLAIYDGARTSLADELRQQGNVQVLEMRTEADVLATAREASGPLAAVILPSDWADNSGPLPIEGYFGHWLSRQTQVALVAQVEDVLTAVTQRQVTIQPQTVYPSLENGGHSLMVALGLVLVILLITSIVVPYLILDEKTAHTLELLRVSPASMNQILLGKGLAGVLFGLMAAAVLLSFNLALVNLWGLMLLAVLSTVVIGVGMGLLVGTLVESEGSVQLWVSLLAVFLMFPLLLVFAQNNPLPEWLQQVAAWLPSTAAFELMRLSFGNDGSLALVGPRITAVLVSVGLVFAIAAWRLHNWEAK